VLLYLAEGVGFEPTVPFSTPVFKTYWTEISSLGESRAKSMSR